MPVMLPPYMGEETDCSYGEQQVFGYLKSSKTDGYVIHSLGFETKGQHEVDFVLVCGKGVLCLEVKGGGVAQEQGHWRYYDFKGNERPGKDPYQQVKDNMHSLRDEYQKYFKSGDIHHVQFARGVIFPDVPFDIRGAGIVPEITFDKRRGLDEFDDFIAGCFEYSAQECRLKNGVAGTQLLNRKDLEAVKDYFRRDFRYLPDLNSQLDGIDVRLDRATEEQYYVLKQLERNKRLLIHGGAGTGKTLIAVEHASRLSSEGKRVLFLSFNKLISNTLRERKRLDNVVFDHFSHFLFRHVYPSDDYRAPEGEEEAFFKRQLPEAFFNMGGLPESERFDALIVDEAQDILDDTSICCLGLMVKGGFERGRVAIFYDENQNIFNSDEKGALEQSIGSLIDDFSFASFALSKNCRSTRRIADFFTKASGNEPMAFNTVDGFKVRLKTYDNNKEQSALLAESVKELLKEGIPLRDIVVISHLKDDNQKSCKSDLSPLNGVCSYSFMKGDVYKPMDGVLQFTTVQKFKGLEAKVAIVVDVYRLEDEGRKAQMRNYTSFSRAKTHLYVLAHNEMKKELSRIIREVD